VGPRIAKPELADLVGRDRHAEQAGLAGDEQLGGAVFRAEHPFFS